MKYIDDVRNKFSNFYIKSLNYLNGSEIKNDFMETDVESIRSNNILYYWAKNFQNFNAQFYYTTINYIKNITMLSLYFSQYSYLFNLLSFKEVKDIFNSEIEEDFFWTELNDILPIIEKLNQKLMKNECILDEKNELKKVQIFCINTICLNLFDLLKENKDIFFNSYQIINYFKDFDFCLKLTIYSFYSSFNKKNHNFINEIHTSLNITDLRFGTYLIDLIKTLNQKKSNNDEKKTI